MAKKKNNGRAQGTWVTKELLRSDAFRSLSSTHKDIWLFILTLRVFGKDAKGNNDYLQLQNRSNLKAPTVAIQDFFHGPAWGMSMPPYNADTIRKAIKRFLAVGFLSIIRQGGNGPGDQSVYQFEDKWKLWKIGDPPCFTKQGLIRGKGFCQPKSGVFFTTSARK
ncbi:hypothetical protein DPPLL_30080 [Desulfofustis limnaeus]|uniref:Uncharacterized protein n=2 Tax=Desulfofustis limnaeus TaxID=2740163 RepID=A0ABM7WCF7_9BACT|nr:hypothetical protein DPPLL_30080 [Desulfofustis limnaeus]